MKNKSLFHTVEYHFRTEEVFKVTFSCSRLSLRVLNQKSKSKLEKNQEETEVGKIGTISLCFFKYITSHIES